MDFVSEFKGLSEKTILQLKEDLKVLRTGRANPVLVENLPVSTYGGQTTLKLMEMATITTEGPVDLLIVPFDPSTIADIEKAILASALGLSAQVQGTKIIVKVPQLSQEQREKLKKVVSQKVEERKEIIRNHRDDMRKKIRSRLEKKEITKDAKFRFEKELDTVTHSYMDGIQKIRENKEREIMEV
ncbi:ribosome-recycling factor [Candidatus Roizmanbacteria bacterium]|nr:ribosome-recycling factor [Candidatus Roizmanbacteria bacterium]